MPRQLPPDLNEHLLADLGAQPDGLGIEALVARFADVYSSGPAFDGWRGSGQPADSSPRLLARAKTWLLSVGWRRLGLIGLLELPKGAVEPHPASS